MPLPGGSADKIGNRYEMRWTIGDLAQVSVIAGLRKHAVDGDATFVFASTQAARSLPDLVVRAEGADNDLSAFLVSLPVELSSEFDKLKQKLGNVAADHAFKAICNSQLKPSHGPRRNRSIADSQPTTSGGS